MKKSLGALCAAALLALSAACGSSDTAAKAAPAPESTATFDQATLDLLGGEESAKHLDTLYQQAIEAGQKTITVYGVTATSSAPLYVAFSKRYPEIKVNHVTVFGPELQAKISGEQTTGQYNGDQVSVGGPDVSFVVENKYLAETEAPLSSKVPKEYVPEGKTLYGGNEYLYTLAYNSDEISADEAPKSFDALLDPKWKGKVGLIDPKIGSTSFISDAIEAGTLDESWLTDIQDNDPVIFPSERDLFTAIASGQIALGVGDYIRGKDFLEADKLPVGFVSDFEDGLSVGVFYRSTLKNAPNPLASDLLVNWWLTPEAQTLIAGQGQQGLTEGAVPIPGVPPLSEIKLNPPPSIASYGDYMTKYNEMFRKAFE